MTTFRASRWLPQGHYDYSETTQLTPGVLVIWRRAPYRVVEVRERAPVDWGDGYRDTWVSQGCPDPATWYQRPMAIVLRHDQHPGRKPLHLIGPAITLWKVLPEHYAVCHRCRELPPCAHVHNETVAASAMKHLEEVMALLPGCCLGCGEPITSRQKTVTFDGPNLIRPDLGDGSVIFHARHACEDYVHDYDKQLADATGCRRRFYCEGRARCHFDGSVDCTEGALCPGDVRHASMEWHHPGGPTVTAGCWCVSGDLSGRLGGAT